MKKVLYSAIFVIFVLGVSSLSYAGEIMLMFPTPEAQEEAMQYKPEVRPTMKPFEYTQQGKKKFIGTKLMEFVKQFEEASYKVDQVELWITAKAETEGLTKLFVSLEGSGGCKVTLRPTPSKQ